MLDRIKMIAFVLILGAVWASALVAVDNATRDRIAAYEKEKVRKSVLTALGMDCEGRDLDELFKTSGIVEESIADEGRTKAVYRMPDGAVAFAIRGSGSQGPIEAIVALEKDLNTLRGMTVVKNTETPGLGDRVLAAGHLEKLKGKKLLPKLLVVKEGTAAGDNQVDAITGATLTSKALEKLLNEGAAGNISLLGEAQAQ